MSVIDQRSSLIVVGEQADANPLRGVNYRQKGREGRGQFRTRIPIHEVIKLKYRPKFSETFPTKSIVLH